LLYWAIFSVYPKILRLIVSGETVAIKPSAKIFSTVKLN